MLGWYIIDRSRNYHLGQDWMFLLNCMSIVVLLFVCLQSVCLDAVCISGMSLLHVPRGYLMDGGQCSPARGAPAYD